MDFVAVPAGTAPVAALALRGADPTLSFATADSFNTTLGNTLCAIAGAPGRMEAAYSNVAAELVGALFTSDPAVLDAPVILHAIDPTKLRAVWLRLLADGQDDAVSLTGRRFRYERDAILAGLDYANLAAGYLVTAADLFLTEAVGTGRAAAALIGGAGTSWIRSGTIGSFATPVRGHPNLYSLAPLADLYRYAPGIFCTASRDQPGDTFRLVIEECQRRAQDARIPYASVASASPLLTARAAAKAFVATAPAGPNWELHGPNGTLGDLGRRAQDWADRCSLAGSITAGGGHAFLEVVCRRFDELEFALPSLHRILEGLLSVQAITNELAALATGCFKPARGLPESVQDLLAIEGACLELVSPMEEQNLISAGQRVAWVCGMLQSAHARGGGGGGGGALAGSSEPSDPGTMQRVRAALSSGASRVFFTELRALLDAAPPNSLTISRKLTSSPIAFIKRMGMGIAPPAAYTSSLWRDEFDRASIHVLKDKWRYNLSMRLAADKYGKVRQTAEKWRIDERTAAAIAEYRFDEVDWFGLIYEVRGIQGDTDFVLAPAEIHYSEIDHFTSLEMVVKRIEDALSLDAPATNSLSSAVDKAHEYFKDNCNSEITRADDIETIQTFLKEMWASVREEWFPVISGRAPLQAFPDVVVPRSSSCWGTLIQAEADSQLSKVLVRSKALSKLLGVSTTRVSYPAGMARPSASGSSRAGRSRSPSPTAGRAVAGRDDAGGGSRSPKAEASPGRGEGAAQMEVFWKNATDFSYSAAGVTVVPGAAAQALGVAKAKFCWPVVASLKGTARERRKYCQTRGHARCVSGEAHEQSDEMRAYFGKIFGGKKRKDFERGRDPDGPDRDYTSKAKAAKLASDLEAEMAVVPAGWPPSTLPGMGGLGARMAFGHPTIIPGYASAPEDDAANAAAALLGMGAAEGGGASHGGGKGGGGRGAKGGKARGSGAKGGTGKEKQEGTADGEKGGKSAARGGGAKRRGSGGGGKGGGKGGGRGRGALVTFASGAAGGARSGADASVPGGGSTSHSGGRETQFQLSVGTARCHTSSSHAAVTPVNSADITGSTSAWGSYGAPLDAGSRLNASSSRELSFSDNQHQQGADDFCAYYGLGWTPSTPSTNESGPSTDGCVRPRLRFAASALGNVAAPRSAARAAVPILLAPLASSYSKIILYVLAISATSAPSLLLPAGGGVWGRAAPRTFAGAMAMKGASAAATRWAL